MRPASRLRNPSSNRGSKRPANRRAVQRHRLRVEVLDDRVAPAQVSLTVTSLADAGPGTLRDAILTADAGSPSDRFAIGFAVTGTIDLQTPLPGLNNSIAIQGPGESSLTVERAAGTSFDAAIVTSDAGQTASLSGLTIANGDHGGIFNDSGTLTVASCAVVNNSFFGEDGPHGVVAQGGGIFNLSGSLTVIGSTVSGNASGYAGGISSAGSLTMSGTTVSGNAATGLDDPVTHNHIAGAGGGVIATTSFTMSNCTVSGNSTDGRGGGMEVGGLNANSATISGCTISDNSAFWGGGIDSQGFLSIGNSTLAWNTAQGGGGALLAESITTVDGCTFSHNSATGATFFSYHFPGSGGAIDSSWPGNTVKDSSFDHNTAELGGAVFTGTSETVTGCSFADNAAIEGGGIYADTQGGGPLGTLNVRGSTFTDNSASDSGGGLYNLGTAVLQECTLSANTAGSDGGGIFNGAPGALAVKDSTVTGNSAPNGADAYSLGGLTVDDSTVGVIGP